MPKEHTIPVVDYELDLAWRDIAPQITDTDVKFVEGVIQAKIPRSYLDVMRWRNGGHFYTSATCPPVENSLVSRILSFGVHDFGAVWNVVRQWTKITEWLPPGLLPVAVDHQGLDACLLELKTGNIGRWNPVSSTFDAKCDSITEFVENLVLYTPDEYAVDDPALLAAARGDVAWLKSAMANGLDVNFQSGNFSLLMCAVVYGQAEVAEFLVRHDCDVHAKNPVGTTAIEFAIGRNQRDMVRFLAGTLPGLLPQMPKSK